MSDADGQAVWEALVERMLGEDGRIEVKRAFGAMALRFDDKIFAMDVKGELVVKLDEARIEDLLDGEHVRPFSPSGRPMRAWAMVGAQRASEWDALADAALAYARSASATRRP